MDYLGALRMFVRAVEVGSFSKAAIATNTKTSTVSRAIASLEEDLGVSLFHRTTRRAHLTEPGATFYEHARGVLRGLEEARDAASAMEGRPQGLIRLHVPSAFARLHIMPFVPDFLAAYPDIRLDVSLSDVRVDLVAVGADLAIRIGPLIDSSLLARKLAPHRRIVVYARATASISTSAPDGSLATSTVERAGGWSPTCCLYTSFIAGKSSRFWRNTVVLTRRSSPLPAASRTAEMLVRHCLVCSWIVLPVTAPVTGS